MTFYFKKIRWNSGFSVGIEEIDSHHKHLFKIFNTMVEDFYKNKENFLPEKYLSNLSEYALMHFKREEEYMLKYEFPKKDFDLHKAQHVQFINKSLEVFTNDVPYEEILSYTFTWLMDHVLFEDSRYYHYFMFKGLDFSELNTKS